MLPYLKLLFRKIKPKKGKIVQCGPSKARIESNAWLREACKDVCGRVLSIGSGDDGDGQGGKYRDYFPLTSEYITSEVSEGFNCDLVLDVRCMPEIEDASFDCIYCSGVLEHVNDFHLGFRELTRILKVGGTLLLGLPFRQGIHMAPNDYWRFTEFGIRALLKEKYAVINMTKIDVFASSDFPASYWVKAKKTATL